MCEPVLQDEHEGISTIALSSFYYRRPVKPVLN